MTSPLTDYLHQIKQGKIQPDPIQRQAIESLDQIYRDLLVRKKQRASPLSHLRRKIKPRAPIRGLYLWGNVGVGKTFLVDLFYRCLPVPKMRLHFHAFMRQTHEDLKQQQGQKNPLQMIAKHIADQVLVICFDEFFVSNIADAMILGELFKHLFYYGVCLVATSNTPPDALYKNGIQRERFLPTIDRLQQQVRVLHLTGQPDYRRTHIQKAGLYYTPLDKQAQSNLEKSFMHFAQSPNVSTDPIEILGRRITIIQQASDTIWFDFKSICGRPRSQNDYLALVQHYQTILVSDVPLMNTASADEVVSFIHLIDVLYDHHCRLVLSAAAAVDDLYPNNTRFPEFSRTQSRLIDMQSMDYINSTLSD